MRSRFFLFVFLVALVLPVLTLFVTADVGTTTERELEAHITAAQSALLDKLESESAHRRELLLHLIALPEVSAAVRDSAGSAQEPSADTVARVRAVLSELYRNETPELIAVVNQSGAQVVVKSGEPKVYKVEALAPAAAALSGQIDVTYSKFENGFYRLTAAPVGNSDAAIILGDLIGDSTVGKQREAVRAAAVTFAIGGKPVIASVGDESLRAQVADIARTGSNSTRTTGTLELHFPGKGLSNIFPIWVPHGAYRSLAHELPGAATTFVVTLKSDLGWTGHVQILSFLIALGIILLGFIWVPAIYGPIYRQARSIEAHLARLRADRNLRLTTKGFSSPFTAIAELLDKVADDWSKEGGPPPLFTREPSPLALQSSGEISRPQIQRPPAELPLGNTAPKVATSEQPPAPSFPFQDDPRITTGRLKPVPPAPPPPATPPDPRLTTGRQKPVPPAPPPKDEPKPPPSPPSRPKPPPPPPEPPPARAEGRVTATAITLPVEKESGPVPLPGTIPPGARNGVPKSEPKRSSTISESDIPAELLQRSQELERELMGGGGDPEEEHYRSVFDEFLALRTRCGEPNEGLTFEKFTARLKKNRDQLIEKYACRTVKFQVYAKDGKAAVKAVPVR